MRIHVGGFHREVDLSIPASSAVAEILDEVLAIAEAPRISRPWRASTVAGLNVDMSLPLHLTELGHGSVLVLTPAVPIDAPIIRDSAEALVAQTTGGGARGALSTAAALASVLLSALLAPTIGWPGALAAGAAALLVLLIWQRHRTELSPVVVGLSTAAATLAVTGGEQPTAASEWAWLLLAAVGTTLLGLVVVAALGAIATRVLACMATVALLLAASCLGVLLPSSVPGFPVAAIASVAVVTGLVAIAASPSLVTTLAGLRVPQLPTAGQDLSIADGNQPDVDDRALNARRLADGVSLGTAIVLVIAALAVGTTGGLAAQLLTLAVAGATVLHAARHRSPVPAWSLAAITLASLAAVVLAALVTPTITTLIIAGLSVVALFTAPLWASRVHTVDPTTVVWWERLELAALILCFPLAAWVGGLFALVRGLG